MTNAQPSPASTVDPTVPADLDPRTVFRAAVATASPVLAGVRDDQLALATPCAGMDVDLLLGHLVMVLQRVAAAGRAVPPFQWPSDMVRMGPVAANAAWHEAAADCVDAWRDDALLGRATALPWTTLPGRAVLGIYTNEVVVHAWDLATATGQTLRVDDAVLEVALAAMHEELPLPDRSPIWDAAKAGMPAGVPWEDPFADAVAIDEHAPLLHRVVAWSGRRP